MTNYKINRQKNTFFALLAICFVLCLTFFLGNSKNKAQGLIGKESAILNPKYKSEICEIRLKLDKEELRLTKQNGIWFGQSADLFFEADAQKIERLIEELCSKRTVYQVSANGALFEDYELDEKNGFNIKALLNDQTIAADLYFGKSNFNGSLISLRSSKNNNILQTSDNFYTFLYIQPNNWADLQLVKTQTGHFYNEEVLQCTINNQPFQNTGDKNSPNTATTQNALNDYLDLLKNAKGSSLVSKQQFENQIPCMQIKIETLHKIYQFNIFAFGDDFAIVSNGNSFGTNCALVISAWTYKRLQPQK